MSKIESINGQSEAIETILTKRKPCKEMFTVSGSIGSGVTWTLNKCAKRWQAFGGAVLQIKGDSMAKGRSLFPWLTMASPGAEYLARLEVLKETVSQGSKSIPFVGSVASYLVQEVLNYRKRNLARQTSFLTTQEQDILYVIQLCARQERLMLIIDQLEDWDEDSWSLLALILSDKLDELYPALSTAVIVVGGNKNIPSRLQSISTNLPRKDFLIRLLNYDEMQIALQTFDIPQINSEDQEKLYKITNSRLDLLGDVSDLFNNQGMRALSSGWTDFYNNLIEKRIEGLKTQIDNLEFVLKAAAIVGETFSFTDVACLTNSSIDSITKTLYLATEEQFVRATGAVAQFDSSDLHQYFHRAGANEHIQYHNKFAECLRLMRPGDYQHRSYHLYFSEEFENAQICHALAVLSAIREYRTIPYNNFQYTNTSFSDFGDYLDKMARAFQAFETDEINNGLSLLEQIESFLPDELLAERDYLEAVFLLATSSVSNYDRARQLLERWINFEKEGELWSRVAQNLIMAQAQTGYINKALELEGKLTSFYWKRRQTDPWALFGLNVLRRRSECLHSLPAANDRLVKALAFFGTSEPELLPRHPIQFYYTLNNLVGNLLAYGSFEEASKKSLILEDLIKRHSLIPWPSLEVATNNTILAHYYSGILKADEASKMMSQIVKHSSESGDDILLQNNLAVLLILSGRSKEARKVLNTAYKTIMESEKPDIYHQYFVFSNLGALLMLDGNAAEANKIIKSCDKKIDQFYPAIRPTIEYRQELLKRIVAKPPKIDPIEYDNFIIQKYGMQIGPQWAFYGRGFLLSDIQFWTMD